MHVFSWKWPGARLRPLWQRAARVGLALLPALSTAFLAAPQASARQPDEVLPIVEVQYRRHGPYYDGPPPRYRHRPPPPPYYYGPPRHYRGYHRPPPPGWRHRPPPGMWGPPPPPRYYYRSHAPYRDDAGAAVAAGVVGLAAGAILGSALSAQGAPARDSGWLDYCASKYRSFDPASGTYLGHDGRRHACR